MCRFSERVRPTCIGEPLVCSRELNFSEIFLVLPFPHFNLYLSAMLDLCRIYERLKIKKGTKKTRPSDADGNIPF